MEKKVARIVWNTEGWRKPSGPKGKAGGETYERTVGFGHDEWLLDDSRVIDGYHYAFIDPIRKGNHAGKTYEIHFFTRNAAEKEKYYLGYISSVYCLTEEEAKITYEQYEHRGWIESMREEIRAIGGDDKNFGLIDNGQTPINILNIRFRLEDVHFLKTPAPLSEDDINTKAEYYRLYDYKEDFKFKNSPELESQKITNTTKDDNRKILRALRTKPFVLLAGISGTGKSRIVRKLAQASVPEWMQQKYDAQSIEKGFERWQLHKPANFELVQVKPNWHNSLEVVGYKSNIGHAHYEYTPFVEFVARAWRHTDVPFFLCLDEMNLAPVEQYFAEFLSAIESRSIENGEYETDPIIKPFREFGDEVCNDMLSHLAGDDENLRKRFKGKGLTLPKNLFVLGTVNMDETTFAFSRKVLDRAMSIVMNDVDYENFFLGGTENDIEEMSEDLTQYLINRDIRGLDARDNDSEVVKKFLCAINNVLDNTPFKLGYRAANEALLYVSAARTLQPAISTEQALDEFTLMKILSRIEGDKRSIGNKLSELTNVITEVYPQSNKKLTEMAETLVTKQFVSYWT